MNCGALERHRFDWYYLLNNTSLFNDLNLKILHVAPEPFFETQIKEYNFDNYITADLYDKRAMVEMDISAIDYPDESFDVILCSHVLEHVEEDRKAISELYRVLKKGSWAILNVPISNEHKTFEDYSIVDPVERIKYFGKDDHVRSYGLDYLDRLIEADFSVEVIKPSDILSKDEIKKMGIRLNENIYQCFKN